MDCGDLVNKWQQRNNIVKLTDIIISKIAFILIPNIFLFFLFHNNNVMNVLFLSHIIFFGAFLAVVSLILSLLLFSITRSNEITLILLILFWIFFWQFEPLYDVVVVYSSAMSRLLLFLLMICVILTCAYTLRGSDTLLSNFKPVFRMLSLGVCFFFIYNTTIAIFSRPIDIEGIDNYKKSDFNIYSNLPNPDIFWIHTDAMMNFDTVEKFFGDSQLELRRYLYNMGFVSNDSASVTGGATIHSLAALKSPNFYDVLYGEYLARHENYLREQRDNVGFYSDFFRIDQLASNLEFINAFQQNGYRTITIGSYFLARFIPVDYLYNTRIGDTAYLFYSHSNLGNILVRAGDLIQLALSITPFSIIEEQITTFINENTSIVGTAIPDCYRIASTSTYRRDERRILSSLTDSFSMSSPKLVYIEVMHTHEIYWSVALRNTNIFFENYVPRYAAYYLYPIAHRSASDFIVSIVDMILDNNPNAVIVIQADHGIKSAEPQGHLASVGFEHHEIVEMYHSTISAVRIPYQYGGLDEPLDPRNIARVLVNRFVGENYKLILCE